MPRFAANLTMLFNESPFLERFALAKACGFSAVEFLFPYAFLAVEIQKELKTHDLKLVLHNLPPGDWDAGERGIGCLPDRVDEFKAGVTKAIEYAKALGVDQLNCLAGIAPIGVDRKILHQTFIANLQYACAELEKANLTLLIEPINTFDIPGFFLSGTAQGVNIINEVGAANLKLQYDIYHAQRMEGELANTILNNLQHIGHIQIADNPGRHEPGTGEIHYDFLFEYLDQIGYQGWIGCEYKPLKRTEDGLGWIKKYLTSTKVS